VEWWTPGSSLPYDGAMTNLLPLLLAAALAAPPAAAGAAGGDAAAQVRAAEAAFAKAFADRDAKAFASFMTADVVFLSPPRTMRGPAEVLAGWGKYLEAKSAPFSWRPEHVAVDAAGATGFSTGPVFDPGGTQIAVYTSVWVRQKDGSWKILFDGPGCAVPPPAPPARDVTDRKE
jgi:ketosteroid isomerase-like protein